MVLAASCHRRHHHHRLQKILSILILELELVSFVVR